MTGSSWIFFSFVEVDTKSDVTHIFYSAMLRTVIIPSEEIISLKVPRSFIGKRIEIKASVIDDDDGSMLMDERLTYIASESSLAKDWMSPEEDEAWKDL